MFVAKFLGEANVVEVEAGRLPGFDALGPDRLHGQAVVRPEHLGIARGTVGPSLLHAEATVEQVAFQGSRFRAHVRLRSRPDIELTVAESSGGRDSGVRPGDIVTLTLDPEVVHVIADDASRVP